MPILSQAFHLPKSGARKGHAALCAGWGKGWWWVKVDLGISFPLKLASCKLHWHVENPNNFPRETNFHIYSILVYPRVIWTNSTWGRNMCYINGTKRIDIPWYTDIPSILQKKTSLDKCRDSIKTWSFAQCARVIACFESLDLNCHVGLSKSCK